MSSLTDWLQVGLLGVNAGFVYAYLRATQGILRANRAQIEVSFRPAIAIKMLGSGLDRNPGLVNIGNGPAIEVRWSLSNSKLGDTISYLEPHAQPLELEVGGQKVLVNSALASGQELAVITCKYRSISGNSYLSSSVFDFEHQRFRTIFSDE